MTAWTRAQCATMTHHGGCWRRGVYQRLRIDFGHYERVVRARKLLEAA